MENTLHEDMKVKDSLSVFERRENCLQNAILFFGLGYAGIYIGKNDVGKLI